MPASDDDGVRMGGSPGRHRPTRIQRINEINQRHAPLRPELLQPDLILPVPLVEETIKPAVELSPYGQPGPAGEPSPRTGARRKLLLALTTGVGVALCATVVWAIVPGSSNTAPTLSPSRGSSAPASSKLPGVGGVNHAAGDYVDPLAPTLPTLPTSSSSIDASQVSSTPSASPSASPTRTTPAPATTTMTNAFVPDVQSSPSTNGSGSTTSTDTGTATNTTSASSASSSASEATSSASSAPSSS